MFLVQADKHMFTWPWNRRHVSDEEVAATLAALEAAKARQPRVDETTDKIEKIIMHNNLAERFHAALTRSEED